MVTALGPSHEPAIAPQAFAPPVSQLRGTTLERLLHAALICAFCSIAYLPSLDVPFAFDDIPNIVLNSAVQPESLPDLSNALNARGDRDRPVAMLTFAADYLVAGLEPRQYHVTNIAVHIAAALTLYLILQLLAATPRAPPSIAANASLFAFGAALLWAVHPVNTQAVTYIVQRMTSLAALFYLAGILVFILMRMGRLKPFLGIPSIALLFALAMLSKAHAATLPAALLLVELFFFRSSRRALALAAALVIGAGSVLLATYAASHLEHFFQAPPHREFSGLERVLTSGRVVWHYISLLVWPDASRLQLDYEVAISRSLVEPPITLLAWMGLVALTGLSALFARKYPWPAFGWLFLLVALSVESSFILLELVFEHRLYLPATMLIAGAVAPACALITTERRRAAAGVAVIVAAGALAWQTVERNREWQDLGRFWQAELARGATPSRALVNSALGYVTSVRPERALEVLDTAEFSSQVDTARVHQLRGEALFGLGRFREALREFRLALESAPGWHRSAYYSGIALLELGELAKAAQVARQMNQRGAPVAYARGLSAELLAREGNHKGAISLLEQVLASADGLSSPSRSLITLHMGNISRREGDLQMAIEYYRAATDYAPQNWSAWTSLHATLSAAGEMRAAEEVRGRLQRNGIRVE